MTEIELSAGPVEYIDTGGSGPVLVLLHGLLMDASLWDEVIADLSADIAAWRQRCRSARIGALCSPVPTCRCQG